MAETVAAHHTDIVGIGRASIADPLLPRRFFSASHSTRQAQENECDSPRIGDKPVLRDQQTLVPSPSSPWWTPPEILASASVGTAQWTALLHRRAALGVVISSMSSESEHPNDPLPLERDDWLLPLTDSSQHEGAFRSVVEFFVKADVLDRIEWLMKYFTVLGLAFAISLVLRRLQNSA